MTLYEKDPWVRWEAIHAKSVTNIRRDWQVSTLQELQGLLISHTPVSGDEIARIRATLAVLDT